MQKPYNKTVRVCSWCNLVIRIPSRAQIYSLNRRTCTFYYLHRIASHLILIFRIVRLCTYRSAVIADCCCCCCCASCALLDASVSESASACPVRPSACERRPGRSPARPLLRPVPPLPSPFRTSDIARVLSAAATEPLVYKQFARECE